MGSDLQTFREIGSDLSIDGELRNNYLRSFKLSSAHIFFRFLQQVTVLTSTKVAGGIMHVGRLISTVCGTLEVFIVASSRTGSSGLITVEASTRSSLCA